MASGCWCSPWAANSSYWTPGRIAASLSRGCGFLKTMWRFIAIRRWRAGAFTHGAAPAWFAWTSKGNDETLMKAVIIMAMIFLGCAGCSITRQSQSNAQLLPALRPYVNEVANELGIMPAERRVVLDTIA